MRTKIKAKSSAFLCLTMLMALLLCPALALAGDIPAGNSSHGYVKDVQLYANADVSAFEFEPQKTEYELVTGSSILRFPRVDLTRELPQWQYYAELYLNGERVSRQLIEYGDAFSTSMVVIKNMQSEESNVVTLKIGRKVDGKDELTDCDVYNFKLIRQPYLTELSVADQNGNELALNSSDPTVSARQAESSTAVCQGESILLTAGVKDGVQIYVGDQKYDVVDQLRLNLADFTAPGSDVAVIPLRLAFAEQNEYCRERQTVIYVSQKDQAPKITRQPAAVTCNKGAAPVLQVTAEKPLNGELTYQWYSCQTDNVEAGQVVAGATSSTFTPPTDQAGEYYYYCRVGNKVGEAIYFTCSQAAPVKVQLSYINTPQIFRQLGTYQDSKGDPSPYRTTYQAGTSFDTMRIEVSAPEDGVEYIFKYYHNTKKSYDGAEVVVPTDASVFGDSGAGTSVKGQYVNDSIRTSKTYPAGKHYFYCEITAIDKAGKAAPVTVKSDFVELDFTELKLEGFSGEGTADEPYLIKNAADFARIQQYVNGGQWCRGVYFEMTDDIELPADWQGIGTVSVYLDASANANAFAGVLDGAGHKLTIPKGAKPLFTLVSDAEVRNLNIYGEQINGAGLVASWFLDYGEDNNYWTGIPNCILVENVRLLSGTSTLGSGLLGGSGSGNNTIIIRNCVVEEGVVIGHDKQQNGIGSFVGGSFNGQIDNCVSYAEVYGKSEVGGLAGGKGQSMGLCVVRNSAFLGKIEASGSSVGGIIASGYISESAPNTPPVSVINCLVAADITGKDNVGGIFGDESGLKMALNRADIYNNVFYGKITATGEKKAVGGILGLYGNVNACQNINNNYFYETSGTVKSGVGSVGLFYVDPEDKYGLPTQAAADTVRQNMARSMTAAEFADGTVLKLLHANGGGHWEQGDKYPVLSDEPIPLNLVLGGAYKDIYAVGEPLDLSGMEAVVTWSDGRVEQVAPADLRIEGYDSGLLGSQTLTAAYGDVIVEFKVNVLKQLPGQTDNPDGTITVYFSLLGDDEHSGDATVHTLADKNLTEWLAKKAYTVEATATVKDVLEQALSAGGIAWTNPSGNYVEALTYKGVELAEFTNGQNSGWMYTLNGEHVQNGISEQFLSDGDEIVFHYTDDYTKEDDSEKWSGGNTEENPFDSAIAPTAKMSRAMAVTVLWRLTEQSSDGAADFKDITSGAWYVDAVSWASGRQIVNGYEDNTFKPNADVTREEMATMLFRYARANGLDTNAVGDLDKFADGNKVSAFASDAMKWAVGMGLMNADNNGSLDPQGSVSYAESTAMTQRLAK